MGSSRPSMVYNSVNNRWEIKGKGGVLKFAIDDTNTGVPIKFFSFVGSSPAIGSIGFNVNGVIATISGGADLKIGDKVFANPRPPIVLINQALCGNFQVPSNSILQMTVHALGTAGGSLPAKGWDVFAIRTG